MKPEEATMCAEILPPLEPARTGDAASPIVAAGVVHDLGNLIQIAASALNVLARTPDMPAVRAGPMLDRAKICLEQAGALVRQNLGRIRDRAMAEERSSVAACLGEVEMLLAAMDQPGLALEFDLDPALPDMRCDPIGLRRAVLNLVLNASEAMAGNGCVLVRAHPARLHDGFAAIEIQVVDRGIGMAPDVIERAFDPYFTTKTGGVGGIGLPTVAGFARAAAGEVSISSAPGAGTIVALRLPAIVPIKSLSEESHA